MVFPSEIVYLIHVLCTFKIISGTEYLFISLSCRSKFILLTDTNNSRTNPRML